MKKTRQVQTVASRCVVVVDTRWRPLWSDIIASASITGVATSSAKLAPRPSRSAAVDNTPLPARVLGLRRSEQDHSCEITVQVGVVDEPIVACLEQHLDDFRQKYGFLSQNWHEMLILVTRNYNLRICK